VAAVFHEVPANSERFSSTALSPSDSAHVAHAAAYFSLPFCSAAGAPPSVNPGTPFCSRPPRAMLGMPGMLSTRARAVRESQKCPPALFPDPARWRQRSVCR